MELHDLIVKELETTKSLASLLYLVERGREVELTVGGKGYFLSIHKSQQVVSLWNESSEQSFDSVEHLLENAVIDRQPFLTVWKDAKIETIF